MTRARLLVLGAAAVAALTLLVLRATRPATDAPSWRWPEGRVARYRLHLEGASTIPSPDGRGTLGGELSMDGVLELGRPAGEAPTLVLRLVSLDRASMTLFGAPAMQDLEGLRAALVGPAAVLGLFPTGDVKQVAFSEGAPTLFETTAQTLVSELQHPLREADEYTLVETTTRGKAEARWRRDGRGLERRRTSYFTLTSFGGVRAADVDSVSRFEFDDEGVLASLDASETLVGRAPDAAARSHLVVRLSPLAIEERVVTTPPRTTVAPLGELKPPRDAREQMLAQRVAGLDRAGLVKGLGDFATSTGEGGLGAFMARASGLLLQDPSRCDDVVTWARAPGRSPREVEFALEVLAAAGSEPAQHAMLALLETNGASATQVQRLSLLEAPTVETARFAEARWKAAVDEDERETLGLTLGAVSGQLARAGHDAEAAPLVDELARALRTAPATRAKVGLVLALGNAGLSSHVDDVVQRLGDGDESVRIAALHALRKTPTPAAHLALQRALTDPSQEVARQAVTELAALPSTADDRAALMAAVRAGAVKLTAAPLVLNVLEPHVKSDPAVRPFLEWLAASPGLDAPLRRRITTLFELESN
jgi:hypothetical protein